MSHIRRLLMAAAVVTGLFTVGVFAAADLKPGDQAPPFSLPGSDGRTYQLADFKGKQAVVLAWFAKAFTGG